MTNVSGILTMATYAVNTTCPEDMKYETHNKRVLNSLIIIVKLRECKKSLFSKLNKLVSVVMVFRLVSALMIN